MPDPPPRRGPFDTSVVIDLDTIAAGALPDTFTISTLTLAELTAAPHAATVGERAVRQELLQRAEAAFEALPFDAAAARAYGRIYEATVASGRKARGLRSVDLLVAATALAAGLPLYTRNARDFGGLEDLVEIVPV